MEKVVSVVGNVAFPTARRDEENSDRLSHTYTTAILLVFSIVVTGTNLVGETINCWVPAHFSDGWEAYTNSYCWVSNTYYLPFDKSIPKPNEDVGQRHIEYYQWVPIMFLVMGFFFFIPALFWRAMNTKSGIDIESIVEEAENFEHIGKQEKRKQTLDYIIEMFTRYVRARREVSKDMTCSLKNLIACSCFCCSRQRGTYLVACYLVTKALYIINACLQIIALNYFLNHNFYMYGLRELKNLIYNTESSGSITFPRVTMCDLKVRVVGNVQRYTVQCVLPINLFNEKLFLFIWFWIVVVIFILVISFVKHFSFAVTNQLAYVNKHLKFTKYRVLSDDENLRRFAVNYLAVDGVFILRIIGSNTNSLIVTEIVKELWEHYNKATNYNTSSQSSLPEYPS
ncbi:unnamed protein product [Dimorphilus gyrociliatus]|uniref:Innexin n=1 Tax=Dimorphilus gyrociliatus TaxID=2664684 RepID=A0A7I8VRK6_9ANNE|nr:unnamed protein product [Dimorphilus gyrociliatus]